MRVDGRRGKEKGGRGRVLCSSASRRGRKASNSRSWMASRTSLGWMVFLLTRIAFSLALFGAPSVTTLYTLWRLVESKREINVLRRQIIDKHRGTLPNRQLRVLLYLRIRRQHAFCQSLHHRSGEAEILHQSLVSIHPCPLVVPQTPALSVVSSASRQSRSFTYINAQHALLALELRQHRSRRIPFPPRCERCLAGVVGAVGHGGSGALSRRHWCGRCVDFLVSGVGEAWAR